jgi:hypothetical protein
MKFWWFKEFQILMGGCARGGPGFYGGVMQKCLPQREILLLSL